MLRTTITSHSFAYLLHYIFASIGFLIRLAICYKQYSSMQESYTVEKVGFGKSDGGQK